MTTSNFQYPVNTMGIIDVEVIRETEAKKVGTWSVPKESVVIYNRYNIQAFFAAAVFAGRVNSKTDSMFNILDTTSALHTDYDEYIWVGVTPKNPDFLKKTVKKEASHTKTNKGAYQEDLLRPSSMYEEALRFLGAPETNMYALGNVINRFYDSNLTLAELIFLQRNYVKAKECIEFNERFVPIPYSEFITKEMKEEFNKFMGKVKHKLKNAYRIHYGSLNGEKIQFCLTALNIEDYCWANRIVRFSHKYYLNVISGFSGYMIDTNIPNLKGIKLVDDHSLIDTY